MSTEDVELLRTIKWLVLENIFWGCVALAVLWYGEDIWKALAIIPLMFVNSLSLKKGRNHVG